MSLLDRIAEERIEEALRAGLFDDLPGLGEPLALEDLSRLPEELRAGYLLLKGAGLIPQAARAGAHVTLGDLLLACTDPGGTASAEERREALVSRYRALLGRRGRAEAGEP